MNRSLTNTIRFFMDECIPPLIRDSRFFMYPFYCLAYRGKNIKQVMDFKKNVYSFSEKEYGEFYNGLNTISRNRLTDLNQPSLKYIIDNIDPSANTLIDIGCGLGYFLKQVKKSNKPLTLYGFDIKDNVPNEDFTYVQGNIEKLPFEDNAFDVVVCSHTIEHLINLEACLTELKRIAKKQLILATPCQRYFYYTLDEHVNFFPFKEKLTSVVDLPNHTCEKIWGDWVYIASMK